MELFVCWFIVSIYFIVVGLTFSFRFVMCCGSSLSISKKAMSLDYTVEEQRKDTEMSDVVGLDEGDGGDKQKVMIKLIAAKDGTSFVLPLEYASISLLVQTVVKCDDEHCSEIPFENVNGPTLAYMVEYMNHHAGKPTAPPLKPLRSNNLADQCTDKWDAELVDRVYSQDQGLQFLYDLIVVRILPSNHV
jgi:hypothetical protein